MQSVPIAAADPISREIWDLKYRLKSEGGSPVEQSIEATWQRVAKAAAAVEPEKSPGFLGGEVPHGRWRTTASCPPAASSRAPAPAAASRSSTASSWARIDDSMAGIFEALKEAALTMQQGGGIGHDFSTLRPKGAPVKGVGADASGPLSFMDVWDAMCRTIMSAGSRRGAMMGDACAATIPTSRTSSPPSATRRGCACSISRCSSPMPSWRRSRPTPTGPWSSAARSTRRVRARDLWDRIMRSTYDYAEPGRDLHRPHQPREQSRLLRDDPGDQSLRRAAAAALWRLPAGLDQSRAAGRATRSRPRPRSTRPRSARSRRAAVRFMDNVVDVSRYPLPQQAEEARAKRRIGLGVTGLADALVDVRRCAMASRRRPSWPRAGWRVIERAAYRASVELAAREGRLPALRRRRLSRLRPCSGLDDDVREADRASTASATRSSPRSRRPARSRSSPAMCRAASSRSSHFATSARCCCPTASRRSEAVEDYAVRAVARAARRRRAAARPASSPPPN